MKLPRFLQPYLASYDLDKLDAKFPSVQTEVITSILNRGDDRSIHWLFGNFKLSNIKKVLNNPQRGSWFPKSLNYWQTVLDIKSSGNNHNAIYANP